MTQINLDEITPRELVPGYHGRFVHTENLTMAFWQVEPGSTLPDHKHPHEQVTTILEGEFELVVNGEKYLCKPGSVVVIPGNVPHNGVAITSCRIIDAFYPARTEYK